MSITLFSRHISKRVLSQEDAKAVHDDIVLFNRMKGTALRLNSRAPEGVSRKKNADDDTPDLRLKENKHLASEARPSIHLQIKNKYQVNTYFTNSANNEAKAVLSSVKELQALNIAEKEDTLKQVNKKLSDTKKRLSELEKTKTCLIKRSRYEKTKTGKCPKLRMPKGSVETWDKETGTFHIWRVSRNGKRTETACYENAYLFETQYLNGKIKELKLRIRNLQSRICKIEASIRKIKEGSLSVCLGSKDFFRKQNTVYQDKHDVWLSVYRKRRYHGMTISGRKDSKDGNFVFAYDPEHHVLLYHSMSEKDIVFPNVVFPYGQKILDTYITEQKKNRFAPIAWRIEETAGSFLIKCIVTTDVPDSTDEDEKPRMNDYYGDGCIGVDINVDCFALSETDSNGNLLNHAIIPFSLDGASSGHAEHILSNALEKVFLFARTAKKPLAFEDLKDVASKEVYGSKKKNRAVSGFAHTKIRFLIESKMRKYQINAVFVNPAYTSQIGKVKYMSRYGLSVHESASLVIARRAMGLKDKVPKRYIGQILPERINKHHWSHWAFLHKAFKKMRPKEFYKRNPRVNTVFFSVPDIPDGVFV